jgi:choline-sulfatase
VSDEKGTGNLDVGRTRREGGVDRRRLLLVAASLGLIVVGGYRYLSEFHTMQLELPLAPLSVRSDLVKSDSLPSTPGALAGRSVVLVTLDTTRPDRIGCYGNSAIETRNIDRLAASGVVFTNALATAPMTLPTHASILTGLYPHHHEARENALYRLSSENTTLAEVLSAHGYVTAAFVSSFVLDERFGLAQGFDRFDDHTGRRSSVTGNAERRADETTDRALAWLAAESRRPFFLWVHYYDPHVVYKPPVEVEDLAENPYDGEIAFVDQQLGRLLDAIEAATAGRALVVLTADHGEALGEQGEQTHGFLVQEATLRIPLIMSAPGGLRQGFRFDERVSQVDLMPTLLALLGIPAPADLDGIDLVARPETARPVLAESHSGHANYGWARLAAIYRGSHKYVDGPIPELYDLERDPLAHENLAGEQRALAEGLRRQLLALRGPDAERLPPPAFELSPGDVERLQALGYAAGGLPEARDGLQGPDPQAMLPTMNRLLSLMGALEAGEGRSRALRWLASLRGSPSPRTVAELIQELEALAVEQPDFAPVHHYLAKFYGQEGRHDAARDAKKRFEDAIRGPTQ